MAVAESALERELGTFQKLKPQLLVKASGRFAVILGDDVLDICDTYEEALSSGYDKAGIDQPFLVRQILPSEQPCRVYRGSIAPC